MVGMPPSRMWMWRTYVRSNMTSACHHLEDIYIYIHICIYIEYVYIYTHNWCVCVCYQWCPIDHIHWDAVVLGPDSGFWICGYITCMSSDSSFIEFGRVSYHQSSVCILSEAMHAQKPLSGSYWHGGLPGCIPTYPGIWNMQSGHYSDLTGPIQQDVKVQWHF